MPIVLFIFLGSFVLDTIGYFVLAYIVQEGRLTTIFKTRRIFKLALLLELNALNFSFVFIPVKYGGELFIVIVSNAAAFFYFVFDLLYFSGRKREYLLWLQEIVFSSNINDVFDFVEDDGSKYEEVRAFPKQMCSIIKKENKLCIQVGSGDTKFFLVPRTQLSKETLALYCQKFELESDLKKEHKVYAHDVPPVTLKEYDNSHLTKCYVFFRDKIEPKKEIILLAVIMIVVLMISINILICHEVLHIDPFAWMETVL